MAAFLSEFFSKTYELFASINVPGTNIPLINVLLGAVGALVSISLLKLFFGLGNSAVSGGLGTVSSLSQKGGNNKNIKTSDERKGDTR